jgi:NADH-quinone oxidoreductase subunit M
MLWMYQRTMLGTTNGTTENISDLSWVELSMFIPLIIMIFWIGLFPGLFLSTALPDVLQVFDFIN